MSVAGNITNTGGDPITYESIAKWITLHGGICEREVNESTTHLICSIQEYKKGTEQSKHQIHPEVETVTNYHNSPKSLEVGQEEM
jgi:hypothetical protein